MSVNTKSLIQIDNPMYDIRKSIDNFFNVVGETHYPVYYSGMFVVIDAHLIPEMYNASKYTPFFWVDDVYLTGTLQLHC